MFLKAATLASPLFFFVLLQQVVSVPQCADIIPVPFVMSRSAVTPTFCTYYAALLPRSEIRY
ncbi:hypothetical protein M378DRAFT_164783, partial [Amanita muscaria Koide BX008]